MNNIRLIYNASFLPRFIRQAFYKLFNKILFWSANVKFGVNMKVYNRFYLKKYPRTKLTIGDNFVVNSGEAINPIYRNIRGCFCLTGDGELIIGDNVAMSSPYIRATTKVTIGNNVKFGALVSIFDTDSHHMNYLERRDENKYSSQGVLAAPVTIEDDVWIGAFTTVLKGVRIGARSVIGANSVVTKDIPADCVAAGNPCRVLKYLNNDKNETT